MASTFTQTATYSNVTRLELEQLRRADSFAGGKALTVGDSAYLAENVVGKGNVNAEPYNTSLVLPLDQVFANTPPTRPGQGLTALTQVGVLASETVQWYGPTQIVTGSTGTVATGTTWTDLSANFSTVLHGDILLVKSVGLGGLNNWAVATVDSVSGTTTLNCIDIVGGSFNTPDTAVYSYLVIRPTAVQLFAVPGSGPTGQEQTFLAVVPTSTLHNTLNPTHAAIMADRITNLVPSTYALPDASPAADRADSVYDSPAPRTLLNYLGYRIVLYPSNAAGTGPDLTLPIATINPTINSTISVDDQRMTVDYSAGAIRFSCVPNPGDQINPHSVVNATTGRLNLYAVYWAFDESALKGCARGLHATRSTENTVYVPGKIEFDTGSNTWRIHSTSGGHNQFYVHAPDAADNSGTLQVDFGTYDSTIHYPRSFVYHDQSNAWTFIRNDSGNELVVADKTALTMGDGAYPALSPGGDAYAISPWYPAYTSSYRKLDTSIAALLKQAAISGYGKVHLRKGRYFIDTTIQMPPGVVLEGEGPGTSIEYVSPNDKPVISFGPNTLWGVYDIDGLVFGHAQPPVINFASLTNKIEGYDICWNATRRVWGVCWADTVANLIVFNEIRADGTWVHPVPGIILGPGDGNALLTVASGNGHKYTPGHYPRIDYEPYSDVYAVVWLEEQPTSHTGVLGTLSFQVSTVHPNNIVIILRQTFGAVSEEYYNPSVVMNQNASDPGNYSVSAAQYATPVGGYPGCRLWGAQFPPGGGSPTTTIVNLDSASPAYANYHPEISSTDIVCTDLGPVIVWSERAHSIFGGVSGTISGGVLTDTSVNFQTYLGTAPPSGTLYSSRFHHLNCTNPAYASVSAGLDGFVTGSPATTSIAVHRSDSQNLAFTDEATNAITWAITPPSRIMSILLPSGSITPIVNGYAPSSATWVREMREPDFVRIHKGSGNFLVVFQAFSSTAYLAQTQLADFSGATLWDCRSQKVYREHLGTCAVILDSYGYLVYPNTPKSPPINGLTATKEADQLLSRSPDVCVKSLGSPDPLVMRPNSLWLNTYTTGAPAVYPYGPKRGYHLDISARHVTYQWTAAQPMSLIPDVTWTGSDWLVVSPTQAYLYSDTGTVITDGASYTDLADPTFYFGSVGTNWSVFIDNVLLVGGVATSEHTVRFAYASTVSAGVNVPWCAVTSQSLVANPTLIHNLVYRVAQDGSLISSSTRLTDNYATPNAFIHSKSETVSRRATYNSGAYSTGGANAPATYGALWPVETDNTIYDSAGWDMAYPSSRISGEIGFTGICAGSPKGYSNQVQEVPMLALAWGENLYGLLDRNTAQGANQILVYRQNCGPFQSGVENLDIIGRKFVHTPLIGTHQSPLQVLSRRHIYTRWGAPASATVGFDTDGYRLCFVHPSEIATPAIDWADYAQYHAGHNQVMRIRWDATYTDAFGNGGIEMQGPTCAYNPDRGLYGFPINDTVINTNSDYVSRLSYANPSSPKVIWNGKNFVAFWTEEQKADADSPVDQVAAGGLLCMGVFPGDESTYKADSSLTPQQDSTLVPVLSQVVRISSGIGSGINVNPTPPSVTYDGSGPGPLNNVDIGQIYVLDVAYSGNTYAVLWCAGLAMDTGNDLSTNNAGNAIGVTVFKDLSFGNAAISYIIAVESVPNTSTIIRYTSPKIVWTGKEYLLCWNNNAPTSFFQYTTMAENGPAEPFQIRRASGYTQQLNANPTVSYSGTIGQLTSPLVLPFIALAPGVIAHAGDIIQIESIAEPGGPPVVLHPGLGTYVIRYCVPQTNIAYLSLPITTDWSAWVGYTIYGTILSAGIGDTLNLSASDSTPQPASSTVLSTDLASRQQFDNSFQVLGSTPTTGTKILDVAYSTENGALAVLYLDSSTPHANLYVTLVPQGTLTATSQTLLCHETSATSIGTAAIGWNGTHYLVTYTYRPTDSSSIANADTLQYFLLGTDLTVVAAGPLQDKSTPTDATVYPIGNLDGQMPGSLYSELAPPVYPNPWITSVYTAGQLQPHCRKMQIKWSSVTGAWLVGVSYLWTVDIIPATQPVQPVFQNPHFVNLNTYNTLDNNPVTAYSGNTLTGTFYVPLVQPGMRLMFWDGAKVGVTMTVLAASGAGSDSTANFYTTLTVDVNETTLTSAEVTMVQYGLTTVLAPVREDTFVFAISEGSAAVQVQDADACWLSNVGISGSAVDVSEVYYWASRPTWRSVGAMTGCADKTTAFRYNTVMERNYTRSFLTPKDKIETIRLTNVRSRTGAKFGKKF